MGNSSLEQLLNNSDTLALQKLFGKPQIPKLSKDTTALMLIDFQYGDSHSEYGLGAIAKTKGVFKETQWYWDRLENTIIPNTQLLLNTARKIGIEIIHVHVSTVTSNGRDSSLPNHRTVCGNSFKDSIDSKFIPELSPIGDEIVLTKVTASPFNSTIVDRVLRNLGIRNIIFAGVVTDGCVASTVRSAAEHNYGRVVIEDATGALLPQLHEYGILGMAYNLAPIMTTSDIIEVLESL